MKHLVVLLSIVAVGTLLFFSGCSFDTGNTPTNNTPTIVNVKTTIAGRVLDEFGNPLAGVEISVGTIKTTTTMFGTFMISNIEVPSNRCVIKATKNGYMNAYRTEEPRVSKITEIVIGLMSNAPIGGFASTSGKTITLPNSASVTLPANGYITTNGVAYNGQVNYAVKHLDPTSKNFFSFFSGDFVGKSSDGTETALESYGVLRVELTGTNGEKLQIAPGSKATLRVPIPSIMQTRAPATIPLWSYDEAIGMWKEESFATKTGNSYVGDVSHFSDWNFDAKIDPCVVYVKVTCGFENQSGIKVHIGQRVIVTDNSLARIRYFPSGTKMKVKVNPEENDGFESVEQEIGPFLAGSADTVVVQLLNCPSYIYGVVTNCENVPTDATIYGKYNDNSGTYYGFAQNGQFKLRIKDGIPSEVRALGYDGRQSDTVSIPALVMDQKYNTGTLVACSGNVGMVFHIEIDNKNNFTNANGVISPDGTKYIVNIEGKLKIFNIADGSLADEFAVSGTGKDTLIISSQPLEISNDGNIVLIQNSKNFELYNLTSKSRLGTYIGEYAHLSPNGLRIITLENIQGKNVIVLYDANTGSKIREFTSFNGNTYANINLLTDFLSDTEFGVLPDISKQTMYIINSNTGNIVRSYSSSINRIFAYSYDKSVIAATRVGDALPGSFFDTRTGNIISKIQFSNSSGSFTPDFPIAITSDHKMAVLQLWSYTDRDKVPVPAVFDINTGFLLKPLAIPPNIRIQTFSYSADGGILAGLYSDSTGKYKVHLWDLKVQ